jgi:hypothetical protein
MIHPSTLLSYLAFIGLLAAPHLQKPKNIMGDVVYSLPAPAYVSTSILPLIEPVETRKMAHFEAAYD